MLTLSDLWPKNNFVTVKKRFFPYDHKNHPFGRNVDISRVIVKKTIFFYNEHKASPKPKRFIAKKTIFHRDHKKSSFSLKC